MRNRSHLLLAALTAALMLALTAGSAWAERGFELSVAEGELGRVRLTYSRLTIGEAFGEPNIVCEVTFTLSLSRTIAKTAGAQVGVVREVAASNCNGTVRLLTENLPWSVTYVSFAGTLPNITSLRLQTNAIGLLYSDSIFIGRFFFVQCLYRGNLQYNTVGNPLTEARLDESVRIPLSVNLSGPCPEHMTLSGVGRYSPAVRVRLI